MLIKNAHIHVGNGYVLKNTDILIENRMIKEINKNIERNNNQLIDGTNCHVFPGFIDPLTGFGCMDFSSRMPDVDDTFNPISPELNSKYAFNPKELEFQKLYSFGLTSVGINPGNLNVVGGRAAVFKTSGLNANEMLLKEDVALKGSVTYSVKDTYSKKNASPMTKMSIFNMLHDFLEKGSKNTKPDEIKNSGNILDKILKREIPFIISANTKQEIDALINIVSNYNVDLIISNAYEFDKSMESILKVKAGIILGNRCLRSRDVYDETDLKKINDLINNDIMVSFTCSSDRSMGSADTYLWNALNLYKAGIDSEEIIKMMTSNPAKMLKIYNRIGSIEIGKEADMVIYSENPIKLYSAKLMYTIINGKIVYFGEDKK